MEQSNRRKDIVAADLTWKGGQKLTTLLSWETFRKALVLPASHRYLVEHYAESVRAMDDAALDEAAVEALAAVKRNVGTVAHKTFDKFRVEVARDECRRRDVLAYGEDDERVGSRYAAVEECFGKQLRAASRERARARDDGRVGIRW